MTRTKTTIRQHILLALAVAALVLTALAGAHLYRSQTHSANGQYHSPVKKAATGQWH